MNDPRMVIAIDPGGTTGIAATFVSPGTLIKQIDLIQVPACNNATGLRLLLQTLTDIINRYAWLGQINEIIVVIENFDFRHEERHRDKINYTPVEVIGAVRAWSFAYPNMIVVRQSAASAKGFWVDKKLKHLTLWVPGMPHAMDALRHLLQYRTFRLNHTYLLDPFKPSGGPDVRKEAT